ncbi:unnamed protein product [Peronospora destructor]|uniref:Uncharacterized protein n=1 Tax=Peronospora destructor TaxID=86335 RepID=A0AAV0VE35_9STRA|nr:unnamed protein product [Peronospora destructor]
MARRPKSSSTTHVHRDEANVPRVKTDMLLHRHRLLRRSSGFMLARKYRNPWPPKNDFAREIKRRFVSRTERSGKIMNENVPVVAFCKMFLVSFPPFLDDEDDDEDDEDDEEEDDEEDEEPDELEDASDEDMLTTEDMVLEEEELVFNYELEQEGRRGGGSSNEGMLSDEYLSALEVVERQECELLRLTQKEERYIIIREDHTDFIMDLICCGEQFSYVSPFQSGFDDDESEDSEEDDDVDDKCPGANTSHLAQEYLLEVLAIKFREQLEDAYQEALQHSLAVQAELLQDELADLKASQKPSSSSRKKKNKKEKKRRKKEAAAQRATEKVNLQDTSTETRTSARSDRRTSAVVTKQQSALASTDGSGDSETEERDPEEDEIDREVEQFRLLLEKINTESALRSRKKLVLPPGSFADITSMTVS